MSVLGDGGITQFFVQSAWVIAALPLWIFLVITFGQNLAVYENKKITVSLTALSTLTGLVWSVFAFIWTLFHHEPFVANLTWIEAGNISLSLGWLVDNLSVMMLLVVTSVSLLIQIYSHGYMEHDEGYHRFFAYLNLFNFSMLGLVLSSNLFQTYIFWELVGVSSFLLIGFWFTRPSAASASIKAFIINRIGDFGLLVGILAFLFYSVNWWANSGDVYLSFASIETAARFVYEAAGPVAYSLIAIAIFMGPMAKSAQFPLHTWLPDAMEGPTPISALIHAATMVAAGVYLIARVYPVFEISTETMTFIAWIGAITALLAASIAIVQYDIKKALAYSTCSQLGYMVMAMGAGAFAAGLFHLMTHAFFKAMLFLCSGAVIHGLSDQQDMRYMGGLRKHMPVVSYTYLIGTLAISGIFFSGFWSKEEIFSGLLDNHRMILLVLALIVAGMTSFYMFRTYFLTFENDYKGHSHPHNSPSVMTVPLIILAIPSVLIGVLLSGKFGLPSFDAYITGGHSGDHHSGIVLPLLSILVAFVGAGLAVALYCENYKKLFRVNLDKFIEKVKPLYISTTNLWFIDKAYYAFIDFVVLPVSRFFSMFDRSVVDGLVNFVGWAVRFEGWALRLFQTGNVQTYIVTLFSGLVFLAFVFTLCCFI